MQIASDIARCTLGDIAIAGAAILAGRWFSRRPFWPFTARFALVVVTVLTGFLLTVAIEWASIHLLARWSYAAKMPVLPYVHIGISPLLQWLIVPIVSLWLAFRSERSGSQPTQSANP
ncbi:hypothetical protein [Brucella intermedia]|uniref:hypothetical protein n=1 Tax=Brucella intermedia TaxID=94625 RepID=UPI0034CF332C